MISAILSALLLAAQHPQQHAHVPGHSFEDTERWVAEFESPERDKRQKPDEVVTALKLRSSDRIADIGAGTGYFTRRFAKAAPGGTVYAVDLEPNMLRYIAKRATTEGQKNIVPVLALPESPMLPPGSVDVIFICNTIHHIENRDAYYAKLRESLAPGGRLVIVDFRKDAELEEGPPKEMRLDRKELEGELARAGFRLSEEHGFLPDQYFVVFTE
jgi:ubiquinone/menaquinone biosynthesis C-methylase UbiE